MAIYAVKVAMTERLEVVVAAESREGASDEAVRRFKNLYGGDIDVEVLDVRLKE